MVIRQFRSPGRAKAVIKLSQFYVMICIIGELLVTNEFTHIPADMNVQLENELAGHCLIFCEVYEDDLKMIQEYLDSVDKMCEVQFQTAYSHWSQLLQDMRQGIITLRDHSPINNPDTFHESLRAFSFTSTVRFLRDIANICGIKVEKQWVERFQANILLIMQSHQQMLCNRQAN